MSKHGIGVEGMRRSQIRNGSDIGNGSDTRSRSQIRNGSDIRRAGLRRLGVRLAVGALATALLVGAPEPAHATGETLKRATSNIFMAPLDMALSPVVAGKTIVTNMREIDDSMAVRVFYALPGYVFLTGVQLGASTIRLITGVLEFVPGLGLVFFDTDLDPLYDPVERGEALVDYDTRFMNFKFGIDYTGGAAY